jgi:hypothetical protein
MHSIVFPPGINHSLIINEIMKNLIRRSKLYIAGSVFGGVAGYLYWKFIGCVTGSCAITSSPVTSTGYFAVVGALVFGLFKKDNKQGSEVHPDKKSV